MLYKFKSKATGDVIMLEPNGRQVLEIIGKAAGPTGIIQPAEMKGAITALEAAIGKEEAAGAPRSPDADDESNGAASGARGVSLRQRAVPFIEMLRRAGAEGHEVVWGV